MIDSYKFDDCVRDICADFMDADLMTAEAMEAAVRKRLARYTNYLMNDEPLPPRPKVEMKVVEVTDEQLMGLE